MLGLCRPTTSSKEARDEGSMCCFGDNSTLAARPFAPRSSLGKQARPSPSLVRSQQKGCIDDTIVQFSVQPESGPGPVKPVPQPGYRAESVEPLNRRKA